MTGPPPLPGPKPPPLPGAVPPRLPPPGKPPRKPLSRGRRIARWSVWTALAVVLVLRYGVLRDFYAEYHRERREQERDARFARFQQGPGGPQGPWRGGPGGRRERPRALVRAATGPVPADFPRLDIRIAPADVETLRAYRWNGWNGEHVERPKVPAVVSEGGVTWSNVMLHLKGSVGSFRPFDDKPGMTLDFSKATPGHEFHGHRKVSLNNSAQDDSLLSEQVSRELFLAAGVPAPRASHATVVVNRRDLGLFVMAEGWGKHFLRRHFEDVGGNLYDSGFCKDIDRDLDVNSGDRPSDRSDLDAVVEAARSPASGRMRRLERVLDVDEFLRFVAMETLTCHWDGYSGNRNNYRVFHDRKTDKVLFLPHGMDQMFGMRRSAPNASIVPHMQGLVAEAVVGLPEGRERYLRTLATLRTNVLDPVRLTNRVAELTARLRPTLEAYGPEFVERQEQAARRLSERIVARAASVDRQLARRFGKLPTPPEEEEAEEPEPGVPVFLRPPPPPR